VSRHYLYYSQQLSLQPGSAHEIHDVLCANAAANLGYEALLVYPDTATTAMSTAAMANPLSWIAPTRPQTPESYFAEFYSVDASLKVAPLPMPWPIGSQKGKWFDVNTIACKYYLPLHLARRTAIAHTRNWNFVKACVQLKIPVIFEQHYYQKKPFEAEIARSPYLQIAITQSPLTRDSLIEQGMPADKTVWMHNGFSPSFLQRQPQEAQDWRDQLLKSPEQPLVLYSGALHSFKGIDVLIHAAKALPDVQFVLTGGTPEQVQHYEQKARDLQVSNVKLLGWVHPRSRLISLFQAADVLAHPHCSGHSADFTNPVKFFQYLAAGTPIAATDITPLRDFQQSQLAIAWCPPDDPSQFADCVRRTLTAYPRRPEGYGSNLDFAQQFTWENRIDRILSHVDEALRPPRANADNPVSANPSSAIA
jgi:glycosyltransferase involved in cell wall biosynthesis